jgi:hypothetical protein
MAWRNGGIGSVKWRKQQWRRTRQRKSVASAKSGVAAKAMAWRRRSVWRNEMKAENQ